MDDRDIETEDAEEEYDQLPSVEIIPEDHRASETEVRRWARRRDAGSVRSVI